MADTRSPAQIERLPHDLSWAQVIGARRIWVLDLFRAGREDLRAYTSGVYILVAHRPPSRPAHPFAYPLGRSSVYYIGKTTKDQPRLIAHQKWARHARERCRESQTVDDLHPRYNYAARFGADVYWVAVRGREDAKDLEAKLMNDFYWTFGALPVANTHSSYLKTTLPHVASADD